MAPAAGYSLSLTAWVRKTNQARRAQQTAPDRLPAQGIAALAGGNQHDHHDLPNLLAGCGAGTPAPGRHYAKDTLFASRDLARAGQFIAECQADVPLPVPPRAYGSYAELLAAPDVDAVYIPLPTGLRREWVIRAAEAGKHVVCEKPCAPTLADLTAMTDACRRHGVQFMDGVMFVHGRRLERLKEVLADGTSIGDIRRIASQFTFRGDADFFAHNMRVHGALEPQGCAGDLGWYSLVFTLEALGGRLPQEVTGRIHSTFGQAAGPGPVPAEFSGELRFADGVSAVFYCSFLTENLYRVVTFPRVRFR